MTEVIKITDIKKQGAALARAGEIIRGGGLVAFPTETVYGLGANGLDAAACRRIYEAKGRPSDNPLILHVANRKMIDAVASLVTPMAEKLIAAFMPGPITLIMQKQGSVPASITGGLTTVGVRMPENDVARALIAAAACPIAAPSANISGRPSPTSAEMTYQDLAGKVPLILDGGPCRFGVESTIVDTTGEIATILRPGAITREMLEEILGPVRLDAALTDAAAVPKAPGMKYRHYAPKAPVTLAEGKAAPALLRREYLSRLAAGEKVGILASTETIAALDAPASLAFDYGARGDLLTIAERLYEGLRHFDETSAQSILAEGVSEDGLGLAIMNRLRKAAGFKTLPQI